MEQKSIPLESAKIGIANNIRIENEQKAKIINVNINNNLNISSNNSLYTDETTSEVKLCESPFIYQKEKYLVDKEKKEIISLYSTFKYLKEKYNINNSRKNRMDCIIKKVKTKYMNAIHDAIKHCVNLKMNKLPQNFITNINIEYNKMYFNKTVEQLYSEFNIVPSLNELINKNLIKNGKKELLIILMNSSLKDIYQYYLTSDLYKYHRMCIIKKEGENSGKLYDYVAQNICKYFIYNKGNKKIINYKNNNFNVSNNNNMYENKFNNEKNILENVNNNFKSIYDIKNNYSVPLNSYKIKFVVTKNK
jgi:hypothetical protein